jgi:hypothetical protein
MDVIRTRNAQTGLMMLRNKTIAKYTRFGQEGSVRLPGGLTLVVERPQERVVSWPGLGQNPAQELTDALLSLHQARAAMDMVAQSIGQSVDGFHMHTGTLVVSVQTDAAEELTMTACTSENNILAACFGSMFLQLSMLQELLAQRAGLKMGPLTLVQTGAYLTGAGRAALCPSVFDRRFHDGYTLKACEATPIVVDATFWSDTRMYLETQGEGVGYTSPFIRQTAIPMLHALKCEEKKQALELAGRIKSSDWRRAMTRFVEGR